MDGIPDITSTRNVLAYFSRPVPYSTR
jgi:hypothetical protein